MNVVDFLLENADTRDKDFVVGTRETLSYRELCLRMNLLAGFIQSEYGRGNEMMLLADNSVFFIICYLAIIKSDNVVVLVDSHVTDAQLREVFGTCSLQAVFVDDRLRSKVAAATNIYTESILPTLSREYALTTETDEDDVAVIIFTSGSTGEKKGVMLTHKNIRVNTESIVTYMALSDADRMAVVLPFYYCYGTSLLHTHLRAGGSIVINKSIFLGSVIKEIDEYRCTGFAGVPATYQILLNKTTFLEHDFPSLHMLAQAGGGLANHFIEKIATAFPAKDFLVMYGATEATARLSYLPPELVLERLGSIGKGIPGVSLEVLDDRDLPVKPGETGQIVASGANIMKGYYDDAAGTKEVIRAGKYYTGDLATVDADGYIYIVARAKDIIKSAGCRISPKEVEEVIAAVDRVKNSLVIGAPDDLMGEAVVALIETDEPSEALKDEIISTCNKSLASHKVPRNIVFSSRFPLNASSKVDTQRLKQLAVERLATSGKETLLSLE